LKNKVTIIAEAGVNHNGDLDKALKLIEAAAIAGVDFVKFQTFKTEKLVDKQAEKAAYQVENTKEAGSQFEMLKKLEIPMEWYNQLITHCHKNKVGFLSTGFDEESIDFLDKLDCHLFKVPSGEITNKRYLQHIARKGKPMIISTGMATTSEIKDALDTCVQAGVKSADITVLHCNTQYPTPFEDVNLMAMLAIADEFGVQIGYSDHTMGIEVPVAAVALGATVIEKHFTLDRSLTGPDHKASLEPSELNAMVTSIRNIELAISGSGKKEPSPSEINNKSAARKSIHLAVDIKFGTIIQEAHLKMLRPGDGISPMEIDNVIGKSAVRDLSANCKLTWEDVS
jgi:N-acetylneuraminate synthase/N,N'-diacetyllegionaminate synthase